MSKVSGDGKRGIRRHLRGEMFLSVLHPLRMAAHTRPEPQLRGGGPFRGIGALYPVIQIPTMNHQTQKGDHMKRIVIEPIREEVLFHQMKKALPYMEREIDWSDLKKHRRDIRIDLFHRR